MYCSNIVLSKFRANENLKKEGIAEEKIKEYVFVGWEDFRGDCCDYYWRS